MPVYSADDLENAIADVKNGVSLKTAAKKNGLPPSTLRGRLTGGKVVRPLAKNNYALLPIKKMTLSAGFCDRKSSATLQLTRNVLARHGDHAPLGRKWTTRFVERHPALKTKLGRRTDWERVNAATPANIKRLFDVYETVDWIPPERQYNADEGGIMEGQGVNGLVIGSSQESPNAVPVKTATVRTWTSIIECISAVGVVLHPLVIFKAKSIQEQWFRREFLEKHLEWLEKVFLPQTAPADPADARLLIVDGHGSHATEEFMAKCYLNNVYLLFLPAHCSHVLQPLDLGCFSSLKAAYRTLVGEHTALTDSTRVGKQRFLDFYARAREIGFQKENIQSGWRAAGLWPVNINKPLASRWVMVLTKSALPPSETHDIVTPKRGGDVVKLFSAKSSSPSSRLSIRKAAAALDKVAIELAMKDREIERLRAQLEAAQPKKKRKIRQDPNECFISLAQILAEANREPDQRVIQSQKGDLDCIVVDGKSSSESEEDPAPLPLFQATGQTYLGTVFNAAFDLIDNERREGFQFLAESIRQLIGQHTIRQPDVIITDFDDSMKAPSMISFLMCSNNFASITLTRISSPDDSDWEDSAPQAQAELSVTDKQLVHALTGDGIPHTYRRVLMMWKRVLFARTEEAHEKAWRDLCKKFDDQRLILRYLHGTYLPVRAQWTRCILRKHRNFGIRVTSGTEASNNNIKSYLLNGMSHLYRLVEAMQDMMKDQERDFKDACAQDEVLTAREYLGSSGDYLGDLPTVISSKALRLINKQYRIARKAVPTGKNPFPEPLSGCNDDCSVSVELGVSCCHKVYAKLGSATSFTRYDVHSHWRLRDSSFQDPCRWILDTRIASALRGRPKNTAQPVPSRMAIGGRSQNVSQLTSLAARHPAGRK
ncbi:hypothetical protein FOFC_03719 [Fusarium oxysporum]|nr:hypothetical protein FOFC_03719 [Fusarium oxysporum]